MADLNCIFPNGGNQKSVAFGVALIEQAIAILDSHAEFKYTAVVFKEQLAQIVAQLSAIQLYEGMSEKSVESIVMLCAELYQLKDETINTVEMYLSKTG